MDLLSLEINAVDYVEETRKDGLERALKEVSGRNDVPEWLPQGSIIGPFFNTQDWGDVKIDNLNDFERVKIHVLVCKTLPFAYMVVISGRVSKNLLESSKEKIEIEELQKKFRAQTKVILDKIGGIISSNKNNLTVFGQTCLIIVSFRCEEDEIGVPSELGRKRMESQINDAELKQLNRTIRDREVFDNMGLNRGGLISITNLADNYISFINQRHIVNFQFSYDEYAIVEFGSDIQLREYIIGFPTYSDKISPELNRLVVLQMLLFWLRSKIILWSDLRDRMRKLQAKAFESEWKGISKIHEELWQSESDFLKEYTFLLDAMKYVERYVDFEKGMQKDWYRKELALPIEYSVSSETDKPLILGVFETITEDIERESTEVRNLYTLIKGQHSMISGNIRDRININLATSNIKLQKQLVYYTVILVILTVALLLQGFGLIK